MLFSGESFNDSEYQGNRWVDYCRGFSGVFTNRAQFLDKALSARALFCSPCLYVSKKTLWGPGGLEFGPNFLEDEALFMPVLFSCDIYVVIDEVFFLRRNRDGSTMTLAPNLKHVNGALNCMEPRRGWFSAKHFRGPGRWPRPTRSDSRGIGCLWPGR